MLTMRTPVILLCGFLLSAVSAAAQGQQQQDARFLGPTASVHGTTGLWNVVSPQVLPPGQAAFSVWYDRIARDPGALTISTVGVGGAVGLTSWLELSANFDINRRILMRHFEHVSFGQQSLGLFGNQTPGSLPTFGELVGGSNRMPQLRSPATRTGALTGAAGYYNEFPFVSRLQGNGVGTVQVGLKINAMAESRGDPFALGFYTYARIPTHRSAQFLLMRPTQTGDWQFGSDVLVSKSIRDTARLFWNVGFRRLQSPDNGRAVLLSDIVPIRMAVVAPLDTRIQFVAEGTADLFVGTRTPNTSFGAEDPLDLTFGFRAFLTRYLHLSAGYRRNVNQGGSDKNGFVFLVGYNYGPPPLAAPVPPPTLTCTGDPAQVEAGQPVRLSAQGVSSTGAPLTYAWTTTGGTIEGSGPMVTLRTTGLSAGTYTATVRASEASGVSADCNVTITVRPPPPPPPPPARPPTVSLRVDRPRVQVGEIVNAIATANSPDNRPLTYQWSVTPSGQVQGTGANVRIDTTGMQPGNYTVRVRVVDDRNLSAEAAAQFAVDAPPPPPPPPQVSKLDECLFRRNSARVDNVCKAKLDNAALRLLSEPDATLAIVGYSESNETNAAQLAQNRANNVRTYLTQDKGIAAGRLDVRTGRGAVGAEYRRVDLHLVPRGATFTGASVFEKLPETPVMAATGSALPTLAADGSRNAGAEKRMMIAKAR